MSLTALSRLGASYSIARATPAFFTPAASSFASRISVNQHGETLKSASFGLRTIKTQAVEKELRVLKEEIDTLKKDIKQLQSEQVSFLTASDWFMLLGLTVFGSAVFSRLMSKAGMKEQD